MDIEKLRELTKQETAKFLTAILDEPDLVKLDEILVSQSINIRLNSLALLYLIEKPDDEDFSNNSLVLAGYYEGLLTGLDIGIRAGYLEGIDLYAKLLHNMINDIENS